MHRYRGYPDFKVLILFMKDSTEGVAEGQTTASAGSVENTEVPGDRAEEK